MYGVWCDVVHELAVGALELQLAAYNGNPCSCGGRVLDAAGWIKLVIPLNKLDSSPTPEEASSSSPGSGSHHGASEIYGDKKQDGACRWGSCSFIVVVILLELR